MRIVEINYHKPANQLIRSLQNHCAELMSMPQQNGITSLKDLEDMIWEYAESQQPNFPKVDIKRLAVISHANVLHEWYNLLYNGEKSMITIFARPDSIEKAFRDSDQARLPKIKQTQS
jgi:hypothetical protein